MTDWTALQKGVPFTLPDCKLVAHLRPVDFTIWAALGNKTDELSAVIQSSIQEIDGQIVFEKPTLTDRLFQGIMQARDLMESYTKAAFVSPRVVDDPHGADEISPKWLGFGDLQFVYGLLNVSLPELTRFSQEQAAGVQSVSDQPIHEQPPV